ncbi:MAG TPA: cob(I)yrinic acid a,c-diamide adenosyltransferase [Candidatus Saccharimonadales bacterium]|nr:cob(I)yrinic acid a,c-diamide adenosyltransferase [Candidatus Saccharimonadales bacterium]
MKIYTKTGDKGKTSLFDGTRVYKDNLRVESYGTIDELNAVLGIVVSFFEEKEYHKQLQENIVMIQNDLFEIGARLANPHVPENPKLMEQLQEHTAQLEVYIDELTIEMPELTYFILPGGGKAGAFLQLARTVSRRAERRIVALCQKEAVEKEVLIYINRLSDVFHTMSRYINFKENKKETIWTSRC